MADRLIGIMVEHVYTKAVQYTKQIAQEDMKK